MYFITTLRVFEDGYVDDCRTVGYYINQEKAEQSCLENWSDIFECGYYNYALITKLSEGLYPTYRDTIKWYKGIYKDNYTSVKVCERPVELKNDYYPYIIG